MKTMKKFAVVLAMAIACMMMLSACGSKWPESYTFKGQLVSDTGAGDLVLELKEDGTLTMEGMIRDNLAGKWSGTWEQNDDGTVTIKFASAESEEIDPAPQFGMTLNDAEVDLGGMGGLTVTTAISEDNVNTVTLKINVAIGDGYTMAFDGEMTQEVSTEE